MPELTPEQHKLIDQIEANTDALLAALDRQDVNQEEEFDNNGWGSSPIMED